MNIKKLRTLRFDFWTLVTIFGYLIVFVLLIYPLFNIFKASFISNETEGLTALIFRSFTNILIESESESTTFPYRTTENFFQRYTTPGQFLTACL